MIANAEPVIVDAEVEPAATGSEIALREDPRNGNGIAIRHVDDVTMPQSPRNLTVEVTKFDLIEKQARMLAHSSFVPAHLVDEKDPLRTQANCFRVAFQADKWNRSVFDVADRTYVTGGKLGYEGKLAASVINTLAGIKGRLEYDYDGSGEDRTVIVSATFKNETKPRTISLSVKQARTKNEMWNKDPDQKLAYCGALRWARRHCPEVLDGVWTDDDLEVIAEQPAPPADNRTPEEIAAAEAAKKAEAEQQRQAAIAKQRAALTGGLAGSGGVSAVAAPVVQQPTTPAVELVNAATKARIVAAFKPSGLSRDQFAAMLVKHGGAGTTELGKLTQPQALQMEGELLGMSPAEVGNARQEVAAAAVEKPVVAAVETSLPPQAASEASPAPTAEPATTIVSHGPTCDTINLNRLNKLVKETPRDIWPMHEIKSYLQARGAATFVQISNQDAVKLIGEIEGRIVKAKKVG